MRLTIVFDKSEVAFRTEHDKFISTDLADNFSTIPANGMLGLTSTSVSIKSGNNLCFYRADTLSSFKEFINGYQGHLLSHRFIDPEYKRVPLPK